MKRRVNIRYSLLATVLLFFTSVVYAQESLSMQQAISKGLENNFQIRIAGENLRVAELNNHWGNTGVLPSVTLGASSVNRYDQVERNTTPPTPESKQYTHSVTPSLNLNWMLFNGFSARISKERFELLEQFSEGNQAIVVENTLQSIMMAYYYLLLENEKLAILNEVKALSADRFTYEEERKAYGSAVSFDVLQAKNAYYTDSTNYLLQQVNVLNAEQNLSLLLGEDQDTKYALTDSFPLNFPDYTIDELVAKLKSANRTIRNQYVNQEILKQNVRSGQSRRYPTLALNAGTDYGQNWYNVVDGNNYDGSNFDYYANFSLSFNLYNGGQTRRDIQEAQINEVIGQLQLDEMELSLSNLLKTQYALYQTRKQLYEVALVNMEVAQLNMELATERFRSGLITSFNYRDIQVIYLNAAQQKLSALYDVLDTHTELLRLTGGIVSEG